MLSTNYYLESKITRLTNFYSIFPFYTPLKTSETFGFLMFSGMGGGGGCENGKIDQKWVKTLLLKSVLKSVSITIIMFNLHNSQN